MGGIFGAWLLFGTVLIGVIFAVQSCRRYVHEINGWDNKPKPKLTAEQRAVIGALRQAQDDVEKLRGEIAVLRGELIAARAEIPPGKEVTFWWDNKEIEYHSVDGNTYHHKFGLRADGALVWRY